MSLINCLRSVIPRRAICWRTAIRRFSTEPTASSLAFTDSVLVLSIVLPSRQETCRFHLSLQTATVGQLIDEIKAEDAGLEHVRVFDQQGQLLAKSYSIGSLMASPFTVELNKQRTFLFDPINKLQVKENIKQANRVDAPSVNDTVGALYSALNSMKAYHDKYDQLKVEANDLTAQLEPLETARKKIARVCEVHISRTIWLGLAAMSCQVGMLAELTWDVYSWDIVEPISYFIAFGTAMSFYAFYLMTRADFEFMTMTDRIFLRKFYREARRQAFDVSLYNRLKNRLFVVHTDLARLRSPLFLSLPVPPTPLKCKISGEEVSPLDVYRARQLV